MVAAWIGLAGGSVGCERGAVAHKSTGQRAPRDSTSTPDSGQPTDSADSDDSDDSHDSADSHDSDDSDDSADTAEVGCLESPARLDQLSIHTADGLLGTSDGLSGQLVVGMTATTTDAWALGRAAVLPSGRPSDGTIARYPDLAAPTEWLGIDPSEGELEILARGDLDGSTGDELVVGIEHPGLVGARVVVASTDWTSGNVLDAELRFTSDATGASPLPITADTDGDGDDDLHIGWKGELERWAGPLLDGDYTAGDGDQLVDGSTRQWGVGGDVDGDGYADIVVATYDGAVLMLGSAEGFSSSVDAPDHRYASGSDAGADLRGIALGQSPDGTTLVALGQVAESTDDPMVTVWDDLDDALARVIIGETGRAALDWANLDGVAGDELVLGRVPTSATDGGLWLFPALNAEPMRVSAQGSTGVPGPLFGRMNTGEERDALIVLDPWGAAEQQPRVYAIDPCGIR